MPIVMSCSKVTANIGKNKIKKDLAIIRVFFFS
jgi:hypothetical protein